MEPRARIHKKHGMQPEVRENLILLAIILAVCLWVVLASV